MTFWTAVCLSSFLTASAADGITTHAALSRGAVESNPLLVNQAVMIGVKLGVGTTTMLAAKKYDKSNPWTVRVLLLAGTALYSSLAVHNLHVYEMQRGTR